MAHPAEPLSQGAPRLPSGAVTIVFTDIEDYSTYETRYGEAVQPMLDEHNRLLREAAAHNDGIEIRVMGDGLFLVFEKTSQAVRFTAEAQRALQEHTWCVTMNGETTPLQLRVRMGLHAGEVRTVVHPTGQHDYFGMAVNKAARVMSAAHGGQVLISEAARLVALDQLPPDITFKDLGTHRLKGVGEERLWHVLHPGLPTEFEPVATLDREKHNLPLPLTPFIGREKELAEWTAKLQQPDTRLLTISGFGGMGKTRIALQLAELCYDDFRDGVWWVPLENATSGDEMVQRIAETLIKNLQPQPTVREQLWNFHRNRGLLLVLDNLEQIAQPDAAQVVLGLLNASPDSKIVATSRRSLEIPAERRVELEPFSMQEAEALFVERAQARRSTFALDANNRADVCAICRKLEGVPLAIEIAASRITLMAPRQILQRVDDQLKALVDRDSTRPRRQQALRAAVEWSYELLHEDAKLLFPQLSVFAGGFPLEAVLAVVCSDDMTTEEPCMDLDEFVVENALMELRNQSLLRSHTDERTQLERLTMLESVREYAAEKLTDAGVRRRHAAYYCRWGSEQGAHLGSSDDHSIIAAFEVEFDNLRAAFAWAEKSDPLLCARLAATFYEPLDIRGYGEEARSYLRKGWNALQSLPDDVVEAGEALHLRATLCHAQASLLDEVGEQSAAHALAMQSLELHRQGRDAVGEASTLNLLAVLANKSGDPTSARRYCEEALEVWPSKHYLGRGKTLHNLGHAAQREGNLVEARWLYEESLTLRRLAGDEQGLAKTLGNLGTVAQQEADFATARRCYGESLHIWRELGHRCNTAIALNNLGDVAALEGDHFRAIVLLLHAERIFLDLKSPYAAEPARRLQELKDKLGQDEYSWLRQDAAVKAWEDFV